LNSPFYPLAVGLKSADPRELFRRKIWLPNHEKSSIVPTRAYV